MKKSMLIPAAAALAILLASCSQTQSTTTAAGSEGASSGSSDGTTVAFVSQIEGIPYFNGFNEGGKKAAAELGITYEQVGPATVDATQQVQLVDNLVKQGVDAIAISPLDPTSINSAMENAQAAGVKVATSDADAPDSSRSVFVSQATNEDLGATAMDELAKGMGSTGEYGIISGSADSATFNAWIKAAEDQNAAQYPDMKLVGGVRYSTDTASALEEAQNLMTANPNLTGIIAVPSTAVPGVGQAVTNAGKIGQITVTGFGSPQTAGPFLQSGAMTSTVLWNVEDLGYLTVWALDQLVQGKEFQAENTVPGMSSPVAYDSATKTLLLGEPMLFTADNFAQYNF